MNTWKSRWIGDVKFYRRVLVVAVPLIVQQLVTQFVNMLDNIMVGQTGTLPMSGVSVANQLYMIYMLTIFGSVAAASIFGAQYAGSKSREGVRDCLRFKLIAETAIAAAFILVFWFGGRQLISLFLNSETNTPEEIGATLEYAGDYLRIMLIGMVPFTLSECLASSVRETGETRIPMIASLAAVAVNFVGNYILIFGHFGAPQMGTNGAALATVLSRFAELGVLLFCMLRGRRRFTFLDGLFRHFAVPVSLAKEIIWKGLPLVANEMLYAGGMAAIVQCYSLRGIGALAAYNISYTITGLFYVYNFAIGDSISILVGRELGAGEIEKARDTDRKMISFAVAASLVFGMILFAVGPCVPALYNVGDAVRREAAQLLRISGLTMWIGAIYTASYFTLRCGGRTLITFLFDSVGVLVVSLPVVYFLAHGTSWTLPYIVLTFHLVDLYKVVLGLYLVNKGIWANDLVAGDRRGTA